MVKYKKEISSVIKSFLKVLQRRFTFVTDKMTYGYSLNIHVFIEFNFFGTLNHFEHNYMIWNIKEFNLTDEEAIGSIKKWHDNPNSTKIEKIRIEYTFLSYPKPAKDKSVKSNIITDIEYYESLSDILKYINERYDIGNNLNVMYNTEQIKIEGEMDFDFNEKNKIVKKINK